jgi:KUP system potassium uptake protein
MLTVTALGIVYGDIGTSPLYALQVALKATGHPLPTTLDVLGIVSLILWALLIVVSLKYVTIILAADNEGEGGILALLSLVTPVRHVHQIRLTVMVFLGILGAALLYGDGVITPAISVLSAMEGLKVAAPAIDHWVLPATCLILIGLFLIQSRGTGSIGRLFGPLMIVWFVAIGLLGVHGIAQAPQVLAAADPRRAMSFLVAEPGIGFIVFGSVFLALTGAEALYADMGHVGAPAIRRAWFGLVLPALLLSYFGQGALVLAHPEAADNPFYKLAPASLQLPLVALAATATVIASQALISGVFSLTRQSIQMRLCPRMEIRATSAKEAGQIYVSL